MGTLGYMSPEQLRGRPVDHRSDIFSFGAILYEMLAGKRAFRGESTADTMSSILREDPPDLSETNKTVSPAFERVVHHCLEKNPEERFHSASDLAFAIEALSSSSTLSGSTTAVSAVLPTPKRKRREFLAWAAAAFCLLLAITLGLLYLRRPSTEERSMRFVIGLPEKATEVAVPVISPDGRTVAFVASVDGKRFIYVRPLDSLTAQRVAGTDNGTFPFWSPDSRYLAFFVENKLKKIEATELAADYLQRTLTKQRNMESRRSDSLRSGELAYPACFRLGRKPSTGFAVGRIKEGNKSIFSKLPTRQ